MRNSSRFVDKRLLLWTFVIADSCYIWHVCTVHVWKSHHVGVAVFSHSSADYIKLSRAAGKSGGTDGQQQRSHRLPHVLKHAETLHAAQPLMPIISSHSVQLQSQTQDSINKCADLGIAQRRECVLYWANLSAQRGHLVSPSSLQ